MTSPFVAFFVPGLPQTAGSKRGFPIKKGGVFTGRVVVVDNNPKAKYWKAKVAQYAEAAVNDSPLLTGPVKVHFEFRMPRLKGHYRSNGELKANAPGRPIVRPDALKLARAVEDSLTGIVWRDDSQIVIEVLEKCYAEMPGVLINVEAL